MDERSERLPAESEISAREFSAKDAAFERALQSAMVRVEAPETLAKFLEKAAEAEMERKQRGRLLRWHKPSAGGHVLVMPRRAAPWIGGAVAAVLAIGVCGIEGVRVHREHERRRAADQQFEQAEAITQRALEHARMQMEKAGFSMDQ